MNPASKFSLSPDVLVQEVGEELVLLDLNRGTYFGLDAVGCRIWQLVEAGISLGEICEILFDEFDVSREDLNRDLATLLEQLIARRLVIPVSHRS